MKRHNVFISYHHAQDQKYKDRFLRMMGNNIIDKSVDLGGIIDQNQPTEATLQHIREEYISQASVTVVLIGPCTWQRKYVDWEIGASLRDTNHNPRCGLLGILLPNHPDFQRRPHNPQLMPPRLADNCDENLKYAHIYDWRRQCHRSPSVDSPSVLAAKETARPAYRQTSLRTEQEGRLCQRLATLARNARRRLSLLRDLCMTHEIP